MTSFDDFVNQLKGKIQEIYGKGITVDDAENLAAEFLNAQLEASEELKKADLDARMRKQGLKALRAAIYLKESTKLDKKPTEATLTALLDSNELIAGEQKAYDEAEATAADIDREYNTFREAHIFLRNISKGSM